jgi:hypothetical protein
MSENGPREGTRDLPRPGPEAGRRSVTADSPAGAAYSSISKSLRRRRAELVSMVEAGATPETAARSYQAEHPLEPIVTVDEITAALDEAKVGSKTPGSKGRDHPRSSTHQAKSST